ncbi:FlgD immunoglobulin-like domain containing protein [Rufibacter radiotolerans]|uniref:FlgD immunoglobulin-like domain containing protein n=1 Tax=Rufibacter radiotolerans TaxID=1379910 RepID=UPI0006646BDF|nr:FlgD immunoglobulin-like domain containing protein [Rufibacter radiotolerans]
MNRTAPQRQFVLSGLLLLVFGALLSFASFIPGLKKQDSHFSLEGLSAAGKLSRAERLHKKGAIGTKDKPEARADYEFDRLKDPATGVIPKGIRELELAVAATIPTVEQVERMKNPYGLFASTAWNSRGPFNVGGRTRAMALDVTNEDHILAGGVSGGMWRSTNGGNSWVKVTGPDQLHSVTTITQDKRPGKTNIWYYGTGEILGNSAGKTGASYLGNGVFKSIDNGVTWNPLPATQSINPTTFNNVFQYMYRVATAPSPTQDEVYAATPSAIWRSVDGGTSWGIVLGGGAAAYSSSSYFTDITVSPAGVKYAGMSQFANGGASTVKGAFRSLDGVNWTNITPANWPATYRRIVMDVSKSDENTVYFFLYTENNAAAKANLWKYQYLSGDGSGSGGEWTDLSANLPMLGGSSGNLDLQGGYNMVVKVKPDNSDVVVLGGTNLYVSIDGFASTATTRKIGGYNPSNTNYALYPNHHPDQHEFIFYPSNPAKTLSSHDGGISRTSNVLASSVAWESLNRGYQTTQFYSVAMDLNTQDDFVVGGMQDNGTWSVSDIDATTLWEEELGGDGSFTAVTKHSLYVSVQNGTVYRYIFDDAGTYKGYSRIDPPTGKGYLFINPYSIDPNNEYTVYIPAGDSLWRNRNVALLPTGTTHSSLGWEVVADINDAETISAVSVSKTPADVVYFGTRNGKVYRLQEASPGYVDVSGTNFPVGANVGCIAVDPRDANKAVVAFTNYRVESLFYTTNGGASWTAVSGNLEEAGKSATIGNGPSTRWVSILPEEGGGTKFFVGTSTGLYSTGSLDGSSTNWLQEGGSSIGQVPIDMVISRTTDNLVLVGTHGNGVFSRRYSGPLATKDEIEKVAQLGLQQNYPNPFRQGGSTIIPFTLEKATDVKLVVYDLSGKLVTTLVSGKKPAGQHQVTWSGRGAGGQTMPSGTYLYQLTLDGKRYTKRMAFIR